MSFGRIFDYWSCSSFGGQAALAQHDYRPDCGNTSTGCETLLRPTRLIPRVVIIRILQPSSRQSTTTKSAGESSAAVITPQYQLAFEQSLGFFDDIPNDIWTGYNQTRARKSEHYRNPKSLNSRIRENYLIINRRGDETILGTSYCASCCNIVLRRCFSSPISLSPSLYMNSVVLDMKGERLMS
jgi:hypothetical protein